MEYLVTYHVQKFENVVHVSHWTSQYAFYTSHVKLIITLHCVLEILHRVITRRMPFLIPRSITTSVQLNFSPPIYERRVERDEIRTASPRRVNWHLATHTAPNRNIAIGLLVPASRSSQWRQSELPIRRTQAVSRCCRRVDSIVVECAPQRGVHFAPTGDDAVRRERK